MSFEIGPVGSVVSVPSTEAVDAPSAPPPPPADPPAPADSWEDAPPKPPVDLASDGSGEIPPEATGSDAAQEIDAAPLLAEGTESDVAESPAEASGAEADAPASTSSEKAAAADGSRALWGSVEEVKTESSSGESDPVSLSSLPLRPGGTVHGSFSLPLANGGSHTIRGSVTVSNPYTNPTGNQYVNIEVEGEQSDRYGPPMATVAVGNKVSLSITVPYSSSANAVQLPDLSNPSSWAPGTSVTTSNEYFAQTSIAAAINYGRVEHHFTASKGDVIGVQKLENGNVRLFGGSVEGVREQLRVGIGWGPISVGIQVTDKVNDYTLKVSEYDPSSNAWRTGDLTVLKSSHSIAAYAKVKAGKFDFGIQHSLSSSTAQLSNLQWDDGVTEETFSVRRGGVSITRHTVDGLGRTEGLTEQGTSTTYSVVLHEVDKKQASNLLQIFAGNTSSANAAGKYDVVIRLNDQQAAQLALRARASVDQNLRYPVSVSDHLLTSLAEGRLTQTLVNAPSVGHIIDILLELWASGNGRPLPGTVRAYRR